MSEPGTATERGKVLERRLQQIEAARVFFEFGTRLSHFDYCDDALWFLREFLKVLPAREVQNNLGLCHLQLARQRMPAELAYLYWMPGVLDGQLRAAAMSTRGAQAIDSLRSGHVAERLSEKARRHLRQAVEYLQSARAADRNYLPARQNLAIAHLYLGQPHAARAVLDEAVAIVPHDTRTAMLTAITVYEQGDEDVDLRPTAIKRLRALREQLAGDREHGSLRLAVEFNLARLLSLGGQDAAAETHWSALAAQARALPTPIRQQVCELPAAQAQCASGPPVRRGDPPWHMPLRIERFESMSAADVAAQLPGWQVTDFDGFDGRLHGSIVRRADGGGAVLVLDDFVQMQVLVATDPARPLGLVRDVIDYCGADLRERLTAYGRLLSCDRLAAVERDGQLQEVWWVSR